jgi:hypothetical protein
MPEFGRKPGLFKKHTLWQARALIASGRMSCAGGEEKGGSGEGTGGNLASSGVDGTVSTIAVQNINKRALDHRIGSVKTLLLDMGDGALGKEHSESIAIGKTKNLNARETKTADSFGANNSTQTFTSGSLAVVGKATVWMRRARMPSERVYMRAH